MERVRTLNYFANQAYKMFSSNECNVVIIAACMPTLRPLFLIVFNRPGREIYLQRKSYGSSSRSRDRPNRVGRVSAPISDSTTAIGHADNEGSWIELGPDQHSSHRSGDIRQTLEVDVTSRRKAESLEEEDNVPIAREGGL